MTRTFTPELTRSIIQDACPKVKGELPLNLSFCDAGLSGNDLLKIQIAFIRKYHRTVSIVMYSDNCFTLTDRLNGDK